jgi:flotillin
MLEHMDALAQASAKAISNIKFDKIVVWEGGGANGTSNTASFVKDMARMMPPMLQVMKDVGGVEIPEFIAKLNMDAPADGKPAVSTNGAVPAATADGPV